MSTNHQEDTKEIHRILENLTTPVKLGESEWLSSCLVRKYLQKNQQMTNYGALKEVFDEILALLKKESDLYAGILRGRFWARQSVPGMRLRNEPVALGERDFYLKQKEAIERFTQILQEQELICSQSFEKEPGMENEKRERNTDEVAKYAQLEATYPNIKGEQRRNAEDEYSAEEQREETGNIDVTANNTQTITATRNNQPQVRNLVALVLVTLFFIAVLGVFGKVNLPFLQFWANAPDGASSPCPNGWFCLFDRAQWQGRKWQFQQPTEKPQDLANYSAQGKATSWYNGLNTDVLIYDANGQLLWCADSQSNNPDVNAQSNNKAYSIRITLSDTEC